MISIETILYLSLLLCLIKLTSTVFMKCFLWPQPVTYILVTVCSCITVLTTFLISMVFFCIHLFVFCINSVYFPYLLHSSTYFVHLYPPLPLLKWYTTDLSVFYTLSFGCISKTDKVITWMNPKDDISKYLLLDNMIGCHHTSFKEIHPYAEERVINQNKIRLPSYYNFWKS